MDGDEQERRETEGSETGRSLPGGAGEGDGAPAEQTNRLVWNPFLGVYLAQAPGRMQRRELTTSCPFCPDRSSGLAPVGAQTWIRPNDFPPLRPPAGECYILIYSPGHNRTFADLSLVEVTQVIDLWQEIYRRLAPRYACVMTWETSGEAIGQTQRHPHGQTFGLAVVPDLLAREMAAVERAAVEGRGCPFCEELARESGGPRVVFAGAHWLGFVPEYARYPYEVHLAPRRHTSAIVGIGPAERDEEGKEGGEENTAVAELARALHGVMRAYNRVYQAPMPYMLAIHQLVDERFHLHIELLPAGRAPGKLKLAASSEAAWGFWVNDSLPEVKAAELRAAMSE
jgi:UDPglucose--hexose-1-phosphate uridylyltransferase